MALVLVVLLGTVRAGTVEQSSAQEKPHLASLNVFSNFLFSEGVWRADNANEKTESPFDSVTRLECYKHGGKELVRTDAYCMEATAQIELGMPAINVTYFPVLVWDEEKVIAAESPTEQFPICIWSQITINLHEHSIMATDTRKLGKGHEGFNNACEAMPLAQTYHLMDESTERIRAAMKPNSGCPKQ
jgi:hypothetical protein